MNQEELQDRILMLNHLEQQEVKPAAPYDPSDGMNESELRNYVRFLYEQVNAKDKSIQELLEELRGMRKDYQKLLSRIDSLTQQLEKINLENRDLKEQNGILKSELYNSSKSRKGIKKNQRTKGKNHGHDDNPDDDSPSPESSSTNSVGSVEQEKKESSTVYHGPSRKGVTYNKCVVGEPIVHKCA
jgi:chromosome segregation ATPase